MISILCGISIYLSSNRSSIQCSLPKGNSSSWQVPFPFTYYHLSLWKLYCWHVLHPHPENRSVANICSVCLCHVSYICSVGFECYHPRVALQQSATILLCLVWPTLAHLIYPPDKSQIEFPKIQNMFYYFPIQNA